MPLAVVRPRTMKLFSGNLSTFVLVIFAGAVLLPWCIYLGIALSSRSQHIEDVKQNLASLVEAYGKDASAHGQILSAPKKGIADMNAQHHHNVDVVVLRSNQSRDGRAANADGSPEVISAQGSFPDRGITVVASMRKSVALSDWRRNAVLEGIGLLIRSVVAIGIGMFLVQQLRTHEATLRELKAARFEADTANRAKSEFLANMSHELRTPLNAILGFSDMTKNAAVGPVDEPYREYAGYIFESGTNLLNLINEILDLSKLEAGRLQLREEEVDPNEIIAASLRLVELQAQKTNVALAAIVEPLLPNLWADSQRLKQILTNILANAIKFSPERGKVTLQARNVPRGLMIEVADNGIGIAPDQVGKALAPFGQIDCGTARKHSGAGLGLPIAKKLVELHGGALTVESAPGESTRVAILLPNARIVRRSLQRDEAIAFA